MRAIMGRAVWRCLGWLLPLLMLLCSGVWYWSASAPERHLAEAERLASRGQVAEAARWLDSPEDAPATRDRALLLRARIALETGRPGDAVRPLDQVDPDGPQGADAAFWKGRTLQALHQPRDAIAWFRRAQKGRRNDAEISRWIAAAAYDLGDRTAAVEALKEVTRLRPEDARAWRTLGLISKEKLRYDAALAAYDISLKIEPTQPAVRFERAETLAGLGRFAEAEAALKASRGGASQADRAALLARCQMARGDREAARRTLDAALAVVPDHPELLGERASIDRAEGDLDAALRRLDRAIEADPYTARWHYQRGMALRSLGRPAESEDALARAKVLQRDLEQLSHLDDEAAQRPDDAAVRERLGDLCLRLGKPDLAASWYEAALSCDPDRPAARRALRSLKTRPNGLIRPGLISPSIPR